MASPKQRAHALAVLSHRQIGSTTSNFDPKAIAAEVRREMDAIRHSEGYTALRGLRLGIVLYRVKEAIGHGKFMPWVKKTFSGAYTHRTATDYMRLARHFVEKTRADVPAVLAIADAQIELALDGEAERALLRKAIKFIGDSSLSQLIAEAAKSGSRDDHSDSTPPPPAPPVNLFGEQTEHVRLLKVTLHDPSALLLMTRQQREQIKDDLWSLYDGYRHLHEQAFGKK